LMITINLVLPRERSGEQIKVLSFSMWTSNQGERVGGGPSAQVRRCPYACCVWCARMTAVLPNCNCCLDLMNALFFKEGLYFATDNPNHLYPLALIFLPFTDPLSRWAGAREEAKSYESVVC
jgi:hypothetical protein